MPAIALSPAAWCKSSYSGGNEGGSNCVQVASYSGRIAVRDSKHPGQGAVTFRAAAWQAFITSLKDGSPHS